MYMYIKVAFYVTFYDHHEKTDNFFSVNRKVNVWFHGLFIALSEDSCHMYTNALTP